METIATNRKTKEKYGLSKRELVSYTIVGAAVIGTCVYLFSIGGGWFAAFLLFLFVLRLGKLFFGDVYNRGLPFLAFLEKGNLVFDFVKQDQKGFRHNIKLSFGLTTISGYSLHSFFRQRPAFLELHIKMGDDDTIMHHTIPLEELPDVEYHKLIAFVEKVIPNKRKAINDNMDTQQKFIAP